MSQSTQCLGPVVPLAMFHVSSLISHIAQIQLTLEFNQFLLSSSEQSQIFIPFNLRKALAKPSFDLGKFSTKSSPISFDLLQSFSLYLPLRFTSSKNWASRLVHCGDRWINSHYLKSSFHISFKYPTFVMVKKSLKEYLFTINFPWTLNFKQMKWHIPSNWGLF